MRNQILIACWAFCCLLLMNCSDDAFLETSQSLNGRFELTVSKGDAATRLELGADGLSTKWEPGDKLALVDKARSQAPIFLSCTLTEPAETAKFVADGRVPAGDYWVIYNYNTDRAYSHCTFLSVDEINKQDKLTMYAELSVEAGDESANISLKHLYAMVKINLQNIPEIYQDGNFKIGVYSSKKGFPMYKCFGEELINAEYGIDFSTLQYNSSYFKSARRQHNVILGDYYYVDPVWANPTDPLLADAQNKVALILPEDLTGEDIYFYITGNIVSPIECWEIKKSDVKFEAGKRYTVNLDMSTATKTTLTGTYTYYSEAEWGNMFPLSTPAECRAASYYGWNSEKYFYQLTNDIDFKDEDFFPIPAYRLYGNGYKLSNITLDWEGEDNVGLIRWDTESNESLCYGRKCNVSDLTLENVIVKGGNFVGALGGYNISASNCKVIGSSVIKGTGDYVGGLVGYNGIAVGGEFPLMADVSIGEYTKIYGKNYTGGIVGAYKEWWSNGATSSQSVNILSTCTSWAEVIGTGDCVGGIFGKIGGTMFADYVSSSYHFNNIDGILALQNCINKGNVIGVNYVGGIGGYMGISVSGPENTTDKAVIINSANEANVTGVSNVGGIVGYSMASINTCYSIKEISASSTNVGGIVGSFYVTDKGTRITNCYSIADLAVETNGYAGGIVGYSDYSNNENVAITNSYFAGKNPSGLGILGYNVVNAYGGGICNISNCLTTLLNLVPDTERLVDCGYDWDLDGSNDLLPQTSAVLTDSHSNVNSIKANKDIINGDEAYSNNTWSEYDYECLKFMNFSVDIDSPDYEDETIN